MVVPTRWDVLVFSGMSTDGKDVFFGSLQSMAQVQVTISSKIYISVAVLDLRRGMRRDRGHGRRNGKA